MAKIQPLLTELLKLASEQNWSAEQLKNEQANLRRPVFLEISKEYVKLSGLSPKNLYCPEAMQEEIWEGIVETVVPDLISECYSDLTTWELEQKLATNQPAKGLAHYAVKFVQSKFAVNGNQTSEGIFKALIEFFTNSNTPEGNQIVRILSEKTTQAAFKKSIDKNLSDVAKSREAIEVFDALEVFLTPLIGQAIVGLSENLNAVQENNPQSLRKIMKKSIKAVTEHFMQLRAVALSHDVANAYELPQSELMKGMTLIRILANTCSWKLKSHRRKRKLMLLKKS